MFLSEINKISIILWSYVKKDYECVFKFEVNVFLKFVLK